MPRLFFKTYYARHLELQRIWQHQSLLFSELTALEQWYLHDYYRLSERLAKTELYSYWLKLHVKRSSLPQCAGRAYGKLKSLPSMTAPTGLSQYVKDSTRVRGKVRQEVDIEKLVMVLLDIARR